MAGKSDLDGLRAAIRGAALRATPSRIATLRTLRAAAVPLSHGEVSQQMADLAFDHATVYRNLIDFVEAGLATRNDVGDHTWRFAASGGKHASDAHPHFVCTSCGGIECLPGLEVVMSRAKAPRSVRQQKIEVHVRGLCDACT